MKGALYWDDRTRYSIQTNNPTEMILKKRHEASWLESCGPTAAVNCLEACGHDTRITTPGGWLPQPEEVLLDCFHDPRNAALLGQFEMPNRVMGLYPPALLAVFGVSAMVLPLRFDSLAAYLETGHSVQLLLKEPGHYIAAVAWDEAAKEVVYWDSWPERFPDGDGFCRRMAEREYDTNVHVTGILYPRRHT